MTPEERRAIHDRLVKQCSKPMKVLPQALQNDCYFLDNSAAQAAATKLSGARLEAALYVISKVARRQAEGTMLLGALIKAARAYDEILQARARKPFLLELVLGVGLAFIPELKAVERIASRTVPRVTSTLALRKLYAAAKSDFAVPNYQAVIEKISKMPKTTIASVVSGFERVPVEQRLITFAETFDEESTHVIHAVRDPLLASSEADADTQARVAGYSASNQVIGNLIDAISRSLWVMTLVQSLLFRFILWSESDTLVDQVKTAFEIADLAADIPYSSNTFPLFADLILYDMLRTYVGSYFVVKKSWTQNIDELPEDWDDDDIAGLDLEQRNQIYKRFANVQWWDPLRPPVKDYKDLLRSWNGKIEVDQGVALSRLGVGPHNSDFKLKHHIALLERLDNGLGFYRFAYNGGKKIYVGVMAQEVQAVRPDAVVRGRDGYLRVFYDKLGLTFQTYDEWLASGARVPVTAVAPQGWYS
jgi:hypothetical protein